MEYWQLIFVNLAVYGFIFQILFVVLIISIAKIYPKEKSTRQLLEDIYNEPTLMVNKIRNNKF
tara:strand:+ start:260 stop:448 length:189 start_codon:yes stop_codon:yes gene_type:complete